MRRAWAVVAAMDFVTLGAIEAVVLQLFVILQVHFEKILQIEFGKITVSIRIKDYIR